MKITIIGASGNIGSCTAFNIAVSGLADEIVMIDDFSPDRLRQCYKIPHGSTATERAHC